MMDNIFLSSSLDCSDQAKIQQLLEICYAEIDSIAGQKAERRPDFDKDLGKLFAHDLRATYKVIEFFRLASREEVLHNRIRLLNTLDCTHGEQTEG